VRTAALFALLACTTIHAQEAARDWTPLLRDAAAWDGHEALSGWAETFTDGPRLFRVQAAKSRALGRDVQAVTGCFEDGKLTALSFVFLDAGAWFGYVPDDQAKAVAAERGPEFARLYKEISAEVEKQLATLGEAGKDVPLGATTWLRQKARVFTAGGVGLRLTLLPDQLVKLTAFRDPRNAGVLLAAPRRSPDRGAQARFFAANVRDLPSGDRVIKGIPVFPQGDRAYCGVSALAMAMQYSGLTLDTEELAAGADIRFGSTHKSHIREVYDAAATEAGLRMSRTSKFDFARARSSIDAGFPVIVFRRWSQARDYVHTEFAKRFAADPTALLPRADATDQKSWPTRDSFAHASIVNGYHAARREVIFSESWSEYARDRRMRFEEMEGTSYLAYYPRL
jgi:hypothetical protein